VAKQEGRTAEEQLPPELALLLQAIRSEFDAKLGSAKLWGGLALLGGSTVSGIIGHFVAPTQTTAAFHAVITIF
jgi:hypothetical protein